MSRSRSGRSRPPRFAGRGLSTRTESSLTLPAFFVPSVTSKKRLPWCCCW